MSRLMDRKGEIYFPWKVISHEGQITRSNKKSHLWLCICVSCGYEKVIDASRFYQPPICKCKINKKLIPCLHGMCGTQVYNSWSAMKARCLSVNHPTYRHYGAKGITICDEWLDFQAFYKDMGDKPSDTHSIDRKDGAKGYFKENCRWSTHEEQSNNTRTNRPVTHNGVTMNLSQWARKVGMSKEMLKHRLDSGWPINKALTEPSMRGKRTYAK